jgi:NADP-dependent 3-hydroxy acid dehydrogenase YdfG
LAPCRFQIVLALELAHRLRLEPDAIARAMAFAIEQPDHVDVGDIVVRPTVQD